jgi:hypothetical protein
MNCPTQHFPFRFLSAFLCSCLFLIVPYFSIILPTMSCPMTTTESNVICCEIFEVRALKLRLDLCQTDITHLALLLLHLPSCAIRRSKLIIKPYILWSILTYTTWSEIHKYTSTELHEACFQPVTHIHWAFDIVLAEDPVLFVAASRCVQ